MGPWKGNGKSGELWFKGSQLLFHGHRYGYLGRIGSGLLIQLDGKSVSNEEPCGLQEKGYAVLSMRRSQSSSLLSLTGNDILEHCSLTELSI